MSDEETRSKKLQQVRKLLDKAMSARNLGNEAEADAFEAKADSMMMQYSIEELELEFERGKDGHDPVIKSFRLVSDAFGDDFELVQHFSSIFLEMCSTMGIKMAGGSYLDYKIVGWPMDVEHLELLYTQVMLHMAMKMNPKATKEMSLEENVVMLKETGLKWADVYDKMKKAGFFEDEPDAMPRRIGVRFTGIYTRYCKEHNRPRQYAQPNVYRRSFLTGYTGRMAMRLREMRAERDRQSEGKELVIVSMKDRLEEFLYENFPHLRPENRPRPSRRTPARRSSARFSSPKVDYGVMDQGARAADSFDLGGSRVGSGNGGELDA